MKSIMLAAAVTAAGIAGQGVAPQATQTLPARISTVGQYLDLCESAEIVSQAACLAYTRGLISGMVGGQYLVQNHRGEKAWEEVFCPYKLNDDQARDLLVKGLKETKVDRALFVYSAGSRIFAEEMPCEKPAA